MSPAILLWIVFSFFAAMILFSGLNRRRSRLTEALKTYVDRHQDGSSNSERKPDSEE